MKFEVLYNPLKTINHDYKLTMKKQNDYLNPAN